MTSFRWDDRNGTIVMKDPVMWPATKEMTEWEVWFAWRPVRLRNGRLVWLMTIARQLVIDEPGKYRYQYKSWAEHVRDVLLGLH